MAKEAIFKFTWSSTALSINLSTFSAYPLFENPLPVQAAPVARHCGYSAPPALASCPSPSSVCSRCQCQLRRNIASHAAPPATLPMAMFVLFMASWKR